MGQGMLTSLTLISIKNNLMKEVDFSHIIMNLCNKDQEKTKFDLQMIFYNSKS